jgi:hypothetical protein
MLRSCDEYQNYEFELTYSDLESVNLLLKM